MADTLTYLWSSSAGGVFGNAGLKDTTWTAPDVTQETVVTLTLLVTDSEGLTDTASVNVTVRAPADTLTYLWSSSAGGVFGNAGLKDTTWTAPDVSQETVVTLTLLVTDSGGLTDTASVDVTVRAPVVAFAVVLALAQTATQNVYTWTNPDAEILSLVCADDDPIVPGTDYSTVETFFDPSQLTASYDRPAARPYYAIKRFLTDEFSNTVGPADNVATTDHAVDAGDISWTFALPQPSVTHVPAATTDHAVDAGAVSWTFNLPQPTVIHIPAVVDVIRLDSLAALDTVFTREDTSSSGGAWQRDPSGSTSSPNTGPGSNSAGAYVFSESSGSDDTLPDASTITVLSTVMAAWLGNGRILVLRACIQGDGTYPNDSASGLQIQGRDSDSDDWVTIDLLEGWGYSDSFTPGDTVMDSLGVDQLVVQAGGWVDFAVTIPDTHTQLRIRNIPSGGATFRHDAAMWHIAFRDGVPVPTDHAVNAGDVSWTFNLPQPTVTHVPAVTPPPTPDTLTYLWSSSAGGVFGNAGLKDTTWTAPDVSQDTVVTLSLLVTDSGGLTDTASVDVTVRAPVVAATITDTQITSTPVALPDTYGVGEVIEFTVTYDVAVDVVGTPQFPMNFGGSPTGGPEYADYAGGTGTTEITFEWIVAATDEDDNGIFLYGSTDAQNRGEINLNGGTIRNAGTTIAADLTTLNRGTKSDHKVDGSLAGVTPVDHVVDAGDVSWTFNLPQPTVTHVPSAPTDHAVDAGDVSWAFNLPQPSVTHVPAGVPDTLTYLWSSNGGGVFGNAGLKDTTWTAPDVSQETVVTLTLLVTDSGGLTDTDSVDVTVRAPVVAFAVVLALAQTATQNVYTWTNPDAEILSLVCADDDPIVPGTDYSTVETFFDPSQLTASYDRPAARPYYAIKRFLTDEFSNTVGPADNVATTDHAVDAGDVSWTFDLPQPTVTHVPAGVPVVPVAGAGVATLEIDFDNDGTFGHPAADVTGDLVRHSLRTTRGRTLQSRRKAVAGRLEAKLWNLAAKYDPINSSSPIYERDLTGVGVRVKLDGTVVWGGILDSPRYRNRPVPQLDIIALGKLSTLRQPVSVATQTMLSIGGIAKLVGDAIGITTTYLTGGKVLDRWKGVDDQDALSVLHDLEETEEGFLLERLDGELALQDENARSTGASATSALTLKSLVAAPTDIPLLEGSALDWGFRYITNAVYVPVTELSETGEITLITGAPNVVIPAGGTRELIFNYPAPSNIADRPTHQGAASWVEPVSGTDYTAQTGLAVVGAVVGDQYRVTFANSSGAPITVDDLEIRGKAVEAGIPVIISAKDAASIARFGEREYPRPSPLFTTIVAAQEYADGIVSRSKSPLGWLVARWPAYYDVDKARTLDVSRRITVERLGETTDYYIEGISLALRGFLRMEYLLSPVPGVNVPSAPVAMVAQVAGQASQLAISWTEPYNGGEAITGYGVRYKKSSDSTWIPWPHTGIGRTATITGLEQGGISYDVQVEATNARGMSAWSVSRTGMTPNQGPDAPAAPTLTGAVGSLGVSWVAPYNGGSPITGYGVRYKKSSDSTWTSWPHTGTGRTATITGLSSLYNWDVQVQAANARGMSVWSVTGTATTTEVVTLYGAKDGFLYTVDPFDASATRVGSLGGGFWRKMTAVESALYIVNDQNRRLYGVNTESGSTTLGVGFGVGNWAVASVGSVFYQVEYASGNLYSRATPDSAETFVGSLGSGRWDAMASIGGTLYVVNRFDSNPVNESQLYSVDPTDAAKTFVDNIGRERVADMTAIGGDLYVVITNKLYTIDPADGSLTLVGNLSGTTWRGLAALIL